MSETAKREYLSNLTRADLLKLCRAMKLTAHTLTTAEVIELIVCATPFWVRTS